MTAHLRDKWPGLTGTNFSQTSSKTPDYNCIAYAAGDESSWWEPYDDEPWPGQFWPAGALREITITAYVNAFELVGFEVCEDCNQEEGVEKIALFASSGEPTHAARLLPSGRWKSKLGDWEDIEHDTLSALEGDAYGRVVVFMRRQLR